MVRSPSRFAVRAMRQAISPRFAIRTDLNIEKRQALLPVIKGYVVLN